jgi:hypothetical protein
MTGDPPRLGYRDPCYVASLTADGVPRRLPGADGWIIERAIPDSPLRDAMGPYPLFDCADWQALPDELPALRESGLVSLVLVGDPFTGEAAREAWPGFDLVRPFKRHYLADLECPPGRAVSRHHRYYARRAAREIEVAVAERPLAHLDEWCGLYGQLVARHGIGDLRSFSRPAFARLLQVPGLLLFRALRQGRAVGAQIILAQDEVAHAHLAAFSDEGYRLGASYALDWAALEYLRGRARYLNWGGGLGVPEAAADGLARYKQGWSTHSRLAYLLGAVLRPAEYTRLCRAREVLGSGYFPAYRQGEYGGGRHEGGGNDV